MLHTWIFVHITVLQSPSEVESTPEVMEHTTHTEPLTTCATVTLRCKGSVGVGGTCYTHVALCCIHSHMWRQYQQWHWWNMLPICTCVLTFVTVTLRGRGDTRCGGVGRTIYTWVSVSSLHLVCSNTTGITTIISDVDYESAVTERWTTNKTISVLNCTITAFLPTIQITSTYHCTIWCSHANNCALMWHVKLPMS